jgi:Protein of unknown function (DUF5818)
MKLRSITLGVAVLLLGFSLPALGRTFSGYIMDNGCAAMGSHAMMEKMHGMKPSPALAGKEARMCTLACVKAGGHFVLYNRAGKKVYNLAPQDDAQPYAGERVSVTGTLHGETIQVSKIKATSVVSKK